MNKIHGNTQGLKARQITRIENICRLRCGGGSIASAQLMEELCAVSYETRRQTGVLIDRSGKIFAVIIGDHRRIMIPDMSRFMAPPGRLRGLRCVHTHLSGEPLSEEDLTDLALLRLDLMAAVTLTKKGLPDLIHAAHILPSSGSDQSHSILPPFLAANDTIDFSALVRALENELSLRQKGLKVESKAQRAILVSVTSTPRHTAQASIDELRELAASGGIRVVDVIIQHRKKPNPRFLLGVGRLAELAVKAMRSGADMIVFDQELSASQVRGITDRTDLKVIDRAQLILDIFAQRAQSREGKIQVELAQLKYILPRLVYKNTAMSRLTGGIGGRGPGETKLEINRRAIRNRIKRLEKGLENVRKSRARQRGKRIRRGLPIISIIGYTNAGKSTLLNTLTQSRVLAENRLFATLDPSSRRLRFPRDTEVIITDTVGFIRNLPKELYTAFKATFEELYTADLLLHVIDASNPAFEDRICAVEQIVRDLGLGEIPLISVLNKIDLAGQLPASEMAARLDAIPICAKQAKTLTPLIDKMASIIEEVRGT
ncbi:MAG: GTPase HflX [Deltaproteobacteria bacterium]|nr:GTPase HflX [Deltaproteobacteria bacterium]